MVQRRQLPCYDAYVNAYEADSVSAFGGIVALNREDRCSYCRRNEQNFLRSYHGDLLSTKEALHILEGKKNIRLIELSKT